MRILIAVLFCIAVADAPTLADVPRTVVDAIVATTSDHALDTLTGGDWHLESHVTVTCYYWSVPGAVCTGGGDFDDSGPCDVGSDNGVTKVRNAGGHCWVRKNFGLNGVADARQCGVMGDGLPGSGTAINTDGYHPDDAVFLNTCLTVAANNDVPVVNTGGGVILDNTTNVEVPANTTLTCGDTEFDHGGSDYRIFNDSGQLSLGKAIVLDPINTPAHSPKVINLVAENTSLVGCTIEAGAGLLDLDTGYPNPYSPSVFYPDCDYPYSGVSGVPCHTPDNPLEFNETRSSVAIQGSFSRPPHPPSGLPLAPAGLSTGIVMQSGASIRNVRVLGFGTCVAIQGPTPVIENLVADCSTGVSIHTSDVPNLVGPNITSDVTTGEAAFIIDHINWVGGAYTVEVEKVTNPVDPGYNFEFADGDIVSIAPLHGAESTNGYWKISGATCATTCTFTLDGAVQAVTIPATLHNTTANGVPPSVLTGIDVTNSDFKFVQIGQGVSGTCIQLNTKVTNIWPATGEVYLSLPVTCTSASTDITFTDTDFSPTEGDCGLTNPPPPGSRGDCAIVDPNLRWGDGIYVENSGGTRAVNCQVYEHLVSFHMYDGARSAFFSNCATDNANDLPDRNLATLISPTYPSGNIISVLIDGRHDHTDDDQSNETDACETHWVNMVLGQHRQNNVVVQSDCDAPNSFTNVAMGGGNSGIDLEVDAGGVSLANASGSSTSFLLKAEQAKLFSYSDGSFHDQGLHTANLTISNNRLNTIDLYLQNNNAGLSTAGCGNVFSAPTPYLCTPAPADLTPGGRLSLASTCMLSSAPPPPVMTADVANGPCVYYVPYVGQQVPIYNPTAMGFGLVDVGAAGLLLSLDSSGSDKQAAGSIYDIFVETENATAAAELCTGPAWTSTTVRASDIQQVQGIWVNKALIAACHHAAGVADRTCPPYACTYLGTMYMTADGETSQQFGPNSATNGAGNCLCLYNAYNRVPVISMSLDSHSSYHYGSTTWRAQDPNGSGISLNYIKYVDGLGQTSVNARLDDLLAGILGAVPSVPRIGMVVNSTSATPVFYAQSAASTANSVSAPLRNPPLFGLSYVQAMESVSATSSPGPSFGGGSQQQISLTIDD